MKRFSILLALALAFLALAPAPAPSRKTARKRGPMGAPETRRIVLAPGDPAPSLGGKAPTGESKTVRWNEHVLTVVNFWATWCVPCKGEMPVLEDLYDRRAKDGLEIVGVEVGRGSAEDARRFLADLKIRFPVIHETPGIQLEWGGMSVLPMTFLVSREGKILRRYAGATPRQTEGLVADVNAVLEGRPLAVQPFPEDEPKPAEPPAPAQPMGKSPRP